jgi:hypothetical protein
MRRDRYLVFLLKVDFSPTRGTTESLLFLPQFFAVPETAQFRMVREKEK